MIRFCTIVICSIGFIFTFVFADTAAQADDLYKSNPWAFLAGDQRASEVGDIVLVNVVQQAEARDSSRHSRGKSSAIGATINVPGLSEGADVDFGRRFDGQGEVRRSQSFVTYLSMKIIDVLPNGNFIVQGSQALSINGERSIVRIRGEIRPIDISSKNMIHSFRIADAEIEFEGQGWVTKGSKPGLFDRVFDFLGLI